MTVPARDYHDLERFIRGRSRRVTSVHPVPCQNTDATDQCLQIRKCDLRAAVRSRNQHVRRVPANTCVASLACVDTSDGDALSQA